jgi:3'-phosphoadenosine 5'-phosphosulfate sulfotransferase (PAPS reductase)/FAD synthetase
VTVATTRPAARLGRKQRADSEHWRENMRNAIRTVPQGRLDELVDRAVQAVRHEARHSRIAYAWSGGKDSQALRHIMEQAGVGECVLGMTTGLEWPAMLRWHTDHMPPECEVIAAPLDLAWLRDRPAMLFPQGAKGPHWFSLIQHRAQRLFSASRRLDLLALGRRRIDGNYVGPRGSDRYTDRHGTTRWSPLAHWSHEEVFALVARERLALPPCYDWPRGFQVGTGAWPARQWTESVDHGFEECWQIDADVIRRAAPELPPAAEWMRRTGRE